MLQPSLKSQKLPERGAAVFEPDALAEIYRMTKWYPYFLQEWGYQSWNHAKASPISLKVVQDATSMVIPRLDKSF
ncbi:MAG: hypothetical protein WC222_02925 [Parachlamydiales bacterium]|jgi:hypothetical protein